jgi:hypothetical protein
MGNVFGGILLREGNKTADVSVPSKWNMMKVFEYCVKKLSVYPGHVWDISFVKQDHVWKSNSVFHCKCIPISKV